MAKIIQKFKVDGKDVIFRYPEEKDAQGIVDLITSFVKEKAMTGESKVPTIKEVEDSLDKKLKSINEKKVTYLVVECCGKIKGRAWISKKEFPQEHIGTLTIHLTKDIRGKGVGDKLMKATIKESKFLKIKIVTLAVMAQNKPAIGLYKKHGFVKNGLLKKGLNYYGKLVDDVLMVKYL